MKPAPDMKSPRFWRPRIKIRWGRQSQQLVDTRRQYEIFEKRAWLWNNSTIMLRTIYINGVAYLCERILPIWEVSSALKLSKTPQYKNQAEHCRIDTTQRYFRVTHLLDGEYVRSRWWIRWKVTSILCQDGVNMPEFYQAFGVKKGDAMWRTPEERVSIW